MHQPVELPARDLHGPDRRRARGGQHGDREARRARNARRRIRRAAAARGGSSGRALQFLPGDGRALGEALLPTRGSQAWYSRARSRRRRRSIASSPRETGPLATLIAETGGLNAMIADSSALPEQVVRDAAQSAFNSAGQRCSALRLLCLQDDTADEVLRLLRGWMDELVIGDPALLATDVGPVIDADAHAQLTAYIDSRRVLHQCRLDADARTRPVRAAHGRRARQRRRAHTRSVRAGAARSPLRVLAIRRAHRRNQRERLWPHPRRPHAHRLVRALDRRARASRQRVREPQHDRRRKLACSRSAAWACQALGRRPAGRAICLDSPPSRRSRRTRRR